MDGTVIFDLPTWILNLDPYGTFHLIYRIYFIRNFKLRPHAGRSTLKFWKQFRPSIKKSMSKLQTYKLIISWDVFSLIFQASFLFYWCKSVHLKLQIEFSLFGRCWIMGVNSTITGPKLILIQICHRKNNHRMLRFNFYPSRSLL